MRKMTAIVAIALLLASCKSKQGTVAEQRADEAKPVQQIIQGHYSHPYDFSTLHIDAKAKYDNGDDSYNVTAEIRIKKGEMILVSIRFLGMTMAKAMITPNRVSYYEKLNKTYFDGNYEALSRLLGTDLDYTKAENLLLGRSLDDLTAGTYTAGLDKGLYRLISKMGMNKEFWFENSFLLKKERIADNNGENGPRSLEVEYPAYAEYPKAVLPSEINITAQQEDKVTININYVSVAFDEALTFPYNVPDDCKQVFLN